MVMLGEISDKVPSLVAIATVAGTIATVAVLIGRIRKWLVLLPLPLVLVFNWITINELLVDTSFTSAIKTELGTSYIWIGFAAWNLPYIAALAATIPVRNWLGVPPPRNPKRQR